MAGHTPAGLNTRVLLCQACIAHYYANCSFKTDEEVDELWAHRLLRDFYSMKRRWYAVVAIAAKVALGLAANAISGIRVTFIEEFREPDGTPLRTRTRILAVRLWLGRGSLVGTTALVRALAQCSSRSWCSRACRRASASSCHTSCVLAWRRHMDRTHMAWQP